MAARLTTSCLVVVVALLLVPVTLARATAAAPTLRVLDAPGAAAAGVPTAVWDTGDGRRGELAVLDPFRFEAPLSVAAHGRMPLGFIDPVNAWEVRLYALAPTRRLIASVRLNAKAAFTPRPNRLPPRRPIASGLVAEGLRALPAALGAFLLCLTVAYVRSRRASA